MLKLIDIYCGAGGLSAGFASALYRDTTGEDIGFQVTYGIDNNADAIRSFRSVHFADIDPDLQQIFAPCIDIKHVTADSIQAAIGEGEIDIIVGGPNCQGVSAAGLRNPDDKRNEMLLRFIKLVGDLRPKWFVMENVPGLTHANNRELLEAIFAEFEKIPGYKVSGDVLLAADFGVPQLRYRLFIVGTNTDCPIRFPQATHMLPASNATTPLSNSRERYVFVEDAIRDLEQIPPHIYDENIMPDSVDPPNHYCVQVGELNTARITSIQPGGDWRSMPICLLPERYFATRISDQKGAYGRLMWDWPAYTITNEANNVTSGPFTHPTQHRSISVREAARLQSFSDDHIFYGSVLSQYSQIGNAVPPRLAQALAEAILICHSDPELAETWGKPGRINSEILKKSRKGKMEFPILTPRVVHSASSHKSKKLPAKQKLGEGNDSIKDVWNLPNRPGDPYPDYLETLRKLSEQPGNYKATKRAKAILRFIQGDSKEEVVRQAKAAEESVRKWVNGYYAYGLDGWRAYNTPALRIANYDNELAVQIENAIHKARQFNFENGSTKDTNSDHKRLHMNSYLTNLKQKFGNMSVWELVDEFEEKMRYGIGTVYVSDLLAICDVVLGSLSHE